MDNILRTNGKYRQAKGREKGPGTQPSPAGIKDVKGLFHYTPAQRAVSMMCWLTLALSLCSQRECGYWGAKNSLKADRFVNPVSSSSGKESSLSRLSGIFSRTDFRLSESGLLSGTPSLMRASPPPAVMSPPRAPPSTAKGADGSGGNHHHNKHHIHHILCEAMFFCCLSHTLFLPYTIIGFLN